MVNVYVCRREGERKWMSKNLVAVLYWHGWHCRQATDHNKSLYVLIVTKKVYKLLRYDNFFKNWEYIQKVIASRYYLLVLQEFFSCLLSEGLIMKIFLQLCAFAAICAIVPLPTLSSIFKTDTEYLWIYMRIFHFGFVS